MNDLRDLYQEVILDHSKRPRNRRAIEGASHLANGRNPLCGDTLVLYLAVDGDVIRDVAFQGEGCAISTASASMLTDAVKGKTVAQARAMFETFHHLLTDGAAGAGELGKLAVFSGVREFPVRVKCATLAWHTLMAALEKRDSASTE
ncbi:MAG TPA: SUF system NifU family Fe-S cluster assembly protein [Candidatus Polarisedimenticolaceae bacterium]